MHGHSILMLLDFFLDWFRITPLLCQAALSFGSICNILSKHSSASGLNLRSVRAAPLLFNTGGIYRVLFQDLFHKFSLYFDTVSSFV